MVKVDMAAASNHPHRKQPMPTFDAPGAASLGSRAVFHHQSFCGNDSSRMP
jgi:hypothetical protein